jgi:hypothetical protein
MVITRMNEAQFQPQLMAVTLLVEAHQRSQVRLIRVEPHLEGATVGAELSSPSEGYIKQPPQVETTSV